MRRYDIARGILLILSIIDFALAAPVLAQEKRQESADVLLMPPKDVRTVLGKRWEEDLGKLGEEFLKTGGKPVESSDSILSSSSTPSGPDSGSTNVVQPPAQNPASSTANPDALTEPSSCSPSTLSKRGLWARGNCLTKSWAFVWSAVKDDDGLHGGLHDPLLFDPTASGYSSESSDHEWTGAHVPQPNLNPNPDLSLNLNPTPLIHPSADPNFDWNYWINAEDSPPPEPVSPNEAHVYQVDPPNPPSTSGYAPGPSPTEPKHEVETPPSSNLGSPKEPEDEVVPGPLTSPDLDHQSLSADSPPPDLQAATYAAKGKAKESRRISGTARDVRNAVQRELQPTTERSLDSGE
jgi:hypothetical protein